MGFASYVTTVIQHMVIMATAHIKVYLKGHRAGSRNFNPREPSPQQLGRLTSQFIAFRLSSRGGLGGWLVWKAGMALANC